MLMKLFTVILIGAPCAWLAWYLIEKAFAQKPVAPEPKVERVEDARAWKMNTETRWSD